MPDDDRITDDIVDMVDTDDIEFLKTSISQQKYDLLKQIRIRKFVIHNVDGFLLQEPIYRIIIFLTPQSD